VAVQNVAKTQYALSELKKAFLKILYPGPRFNELVIQLPIPYENVAAKFTSAKIIPGLPLEKYYPSLKNSLLLSFTETKRKADIDRLIQLLSSSA
jgi:glycine dehydrogenase subunit 1